MTDTSGEVLRRLATDSALVQKRLRVIEEWIQSGEVEPWLGVVLGEWSRRNGGSSGQPTAADFEAIFADDELFEAMRSQVDGPWMVYADQVRSSQANDRVMSFLTELEDVATNAS